MRKRTGVLLALCASLWLTPSFAADWPNFRGGAGNTGASAESLALPLTEVWHSTAPLVEENGGVVSNGIVYMSSNARLLYAFHVATGLDVAGFPVTIGTTYGVPAVDSANGKLYSLSSTGLEAFNLNGTAAWTATMVGGYNLNEGPVVDLGYVYVKDSGGVLYKYDSAGALQWSVSAGGGGSQPSIMGSYVYSNTGSSIRKFDKATGTEVTTGGFPISASSTDSPVTTVNGRIFQLSSSGVSVFNDADGSLLWSQAGGGYGGYATPAVSGGVVYVYGYNDAMLYAFNETTGAAMTGFPSVALNTTGRNWSSPTVSGDKVFVGAGASQKLYVLGAAGSAGAGQVLAEYQLYSADTQGFDVCSPIVSDGYVFSMLDGGGLYAFYAGGGTAPAGALSINDGATCTASADVTLTLDNNGDTSIVSMRISENAQFTGASWEAFSTTKSFTLSEGFGTKTVYAQFMNNSEQLSNVFTAQIEYSEACTAPPPAPGPSPTLTVERDGLGAGWFGSCGMVVGHDGKGPMSGAESAGMIALYFALLLLPVAILKLVHGRKRRLFGKTGIVALFLVVSMLVASSAGAERLIAPKAQRFHPTTDGQGALTVDTDQPLCPGQFNVGLTLSGAKKPLDMGDIRELKVQKVVVDELYTADLLVAYGITPDITLGLDVPYDFSRDNLNYTDYLKNGAPGVRDDVFHLGDIRLNAKFRVIEGARYGLALIPFANFATGDRDYLLSEGKFGFGMKLAGHFDVIKQLTLYANLGAEHIGNIATQSSASGYYTPWIQYGVGAKYLLPWRKDSIVAEVNGETVWATPFAHSTLSPLEVLAAYRAEVAPGWTLQAGGGGGLNKGMGAPQWRAILGIAYKM